MKLTAITVLGIGGLEDGRIEIPGGSVAAFAGANGTGKSKLLGCLLAPWTRALPGMGGAKQEAQATVEIELTAEERTAIGGLSTTMGWGEVGVPAKVSLGVRQAPLTGVQILAEPDLNVLKNMFAGDFLRQQESLSVVYLPAERRLVSGGQPGIDLNQLSELIAYQKTVETRSAVQNYGRLDDQEFEQFAKALCVAESLPDSETDEGADESRFESRLAWPDFVDTVNGLIAPKRLLPLTRQHPDQLRIETPSGHLHAVQDLSSGERQALIVISRVLRSGTGGRVVLIDEPDAYLHPHLSRRLMQALEQGVAENGQLVVATHSPSVLDSLSAEAIIRLGYQEPARRVADEGERIDLYRTAGFRASALTQSDVLVSCEGESDANLLLLSLPELARASLRSAGGRARVLREVEQLNPYKLPILGVVDRDVLADPIEAPLASRITVWPAADIEGVFLSDPGVLQAMIGLGLLKAGFDTVEAVQRVLTSLQEQLKERVVAEIAQRKLRKTAEQEWPSPRGDDPVTRLRDAVANMELPDSAAVEGAITEAEQIWTDASEDRWSIVRGKYLLNEFANRSSEMKSGSALLEAVARQRPNVGGLAEFCARLGTALATTGNT